MAKGLKICPYCANEIKEGAIKCQYCHEFLNLEESKEKAKKSKDETKQTNKTSNSMKEREQLSAGEQDYINNKLTWMKVLTFFLTGIGLIRCKRWFDFALCLVIAFILGALGVGPISLILTRCIALINFSQKAYDSDPTYFQKYLSEYKQLGKSKK